MEKSYGELCFEPVFSGRNPKTGRFVKGHHPANKGKKWDEYMSKRNQRKAARGWKNLDIHRHRSENAGRPKKPVIAVIDDGTWLWLPYECRAQGQDDHLALLRTRNQRCR